MYLSRQLEYNKKGILVNENYQTNIPNIYAIGDVTGKMMLAHSATYSGYRVLNHILGKKDNINFNLVPSCVFTFPEVASIGLTKEDLEKEELEAKTIKVLYRSVGKAVAMNHEDGFLKLIIRENKIIEKGVCCMFFLDGTTSLKSFQLSGIR